MQSMTRPLKQWLCRNRDHPYPTKLDKEYLAEESQMSLTQVANWFANARRRLKNVVQGDNLTWSTRVKHYNSHVVGNAELLSLSSDDSLLELEETEDDSKTETSQAGPSFVSQGQQIFGTVTSSVSRSHVTHGSTSGHSDDVVPSRSQTPISNPSFSDCFDSEPHSPFHRPRQSFFDHGTQGKYKQIILQRYLSDTISQASSSHPPGIDMEYSAFNKTRSRKPSGSIGSRDYEEMSTASGISSNDGHHLAVFDESVDDLEAAARRRHISGDRRQEDIHLKEISAVMALTSLARSRKNNP
ncbi:hypothetical protein FSP39_011744 [Pinctada imbricata]|uniref:Homeobox domain-containing protein n=1 Tax=Pinctada imbricata TaxID=66713 RepID=A0AA89BUI1_PINIB|nr:hypothetical protein FSP39_011744 [Pinctada imbricata]